MTVINVKGQEWDVASIDGNTVTLADGQEIEVNDATLAQIEHELTLLAQVVNNAEKSAKKRTRKKS